MYISFQNDILERDSRKRRSRGPRARIARRVVKVESYRLTFTNNQRYSAPRSSSACRPAERYQALKGVPLVSVAWFRVPLLRRTVRERLGHASVNSLTARSRGNDRGCGQRPGYQDRRGNRRQARAAPAIRDLVALICRRPARVSRDDTENLSP